MWMAGSVLMQRNSWTLTSNLNAKF
jgi:hypothetical protein